MSTTLTVARASEINLPPEERRCVHGAHVDHQADTDINLTAAERDALDTWAQDMIDDLPPIRADVNGCVAADTGHDGGVRPAPMRLGFRFWAGLFLRATWPYWVLAVALLVLSLAKGAR